MASHESLATRLYRGHVSYDFIGRRRVWYLISGLVVVLSIGSLFIRGLDPSIDFKGGDVFQLPVNGHSIADVNTSMSKVGVTPEVVQTTGTSSATRFRVETKTLSEAKVNQIEQQLATDIGVPRTAVNIQSVGSTWGSQITHKAIVGLIAFLLMVIIYLSIRFDWKMALAAIVALIHDLIITAGIYSLVGFEVSPSTVIALLTILGYSLYDTVVVFDKVRENTAGLAGSSRMTYSQAANLAVNQTLVRSINTSIIALLPVVGLLVIGAGFLGAGSLKDLALALMIGLASGAYSSIFIATPLVTELKERESTYQALARRVAARKAKGLSTPQVTPAVATATAGASEGFDTTAPEPAAPVVSRTPAPGPRPGARPTGQRRTGRPGGRSSKRKRR